MRTSTLERDLGLRTLAGTGELERPSKWTADWVKHRMIEAFTIERRIPDRRVGPAIVKGAWAKIDTTDSFADRVYQGELAREHVWDKWARAGGALPHEVSRMEEALSWPGQVLSNGHATEGKVLLAWAFCQAYGKPLRRMCRQRGWSRTTFYHCVECGAQRIADYLNARGTAVR